MVRTEEPRVNNNRRRLLGLLAPAAAVALCPAAQRAPAGDLERDVVALLRAGKPKAAVLAILSSRDLGAPAELDPEDEARTAVWRAMRDRRWEDALDGVLAAWRASKGTMTRNDRHDITIALLGSGSRVLRDIENTAPVGA